MKRVLGFLICGFLVFSSVSKAEDEVMLQYSHSTLNAGYSSWNDVNILNYLNVQTDHQFVIETDYKNRFGESGLLAAMNYTDTYSPEWYQDFSVTASTNSNILPAWLVFSEIHRKFLGQKNLVAGIGLGYVATHDPYTDINGLAEATYFFEHNFSFEGGIRFNRSNPGSVFTVRGFGVLSYLYDSRIEAALKLEAGREGYTIVGANQFVNEFSSKEESLQVRYWWSPRWGTSLNFDFYQSAFYDRNEIALAVLMKY